MWHRRMLIMSLNGLWIKNWCCVVFGKHSRVEESRFWWQVCVLFLVRWLESIKVHNEDWFTLRAVNITNLRIYWRNGNCWLGSHWRLATEVDARHYFTVQNIFDALDRQQNLLLMSQLYNANVLKVFLVEFRHVSYGLKAFVLKLCNVLIET